MSYEAQFFQSLALTITLELGAAILLKKFAAHWKVAWPQFIVGVILASTLTLPYVWFLFPAFIKSRLIFILASEMWAWWGEAFFYKYFFNTSFKKMLVFSGIVNAFSFGVGSIFIS